MYRWDAAEHEIKDKQDGADLLGGYIGRTVTLSGEETEASKGGERVDQGPVGEGEGRRREGENVYVC